MPNSLEKESLIENKKNNIIKYDFKPEFVIENNSSEKLLKETSRTSSEVSNYDDVINKRLTSCNKKYKDLFIKDMLDEYIEDGYISISQKLYSIIEEEYGSIVASIFLNNVYQEYALNNKIIKSILYIIGRLNPNYLNGIEVGITAFALNNVDYEVRDMALQCFEKWNNKKHLRLLKSLKLDVDFLQEYLESIIKQIESE